ncbi:MAG: hypothetical protein WAU58_15995 [Terriglobales bacterium]
MRNPSTSMAAVLASLLLAVVLPSTRSVAKVNPEEFSQTAIVIKVTTEREIEGARRRGKVRYGNEFFVVTEVGDKVYDLNGDQRIEPGTYRAKINGKGNRVRFLLDSKDGKPKCSAWYKVTGEQAKIGEKPK